VLSSQDGMAPPVFSLYHRGVTMAKYISTLFSQIRGKVAGVIYSANQFQPIISRPYTPPTYTRTPGQNRARNAFLTAAAYWDSEIAGSVQIEWEAWNAVWKRFPSGRHAWIAYCSMMLQIYDLGGNMNAKTPVHPPIGDGLLPVSISAGEYEGPIGTTGYGLVIQNDYDEDVHVWIRSSIPFTKSRNRFQGPFGMPYGAMATVIKNATDNVPVFYPVENCYVFSAAIVYYYDELEHVFYYNVADVSRYPTNTQAGTLLAPPAGPAEASPTAAKTKKTVSPPVA